MNKFSIGDKVLCIGMRDDYYTKLKVGQVYTISTYSKRKYNLRGNDWITVLEDSDQYEIEYFEPFYDFEDCTNTVIGI